MMKLIVANLKMNLTFNDILEYSKKLNSSNYVNNKIVVCPSYPFVSIMSFSLDRKRYYIGSQDVSCHSDNKCTGDVSSLQLSSISVNYCIVGHLERRLNYGESSKQIGEKIANLEKYNIIPIICIGENEDNWKYDLKQQLDEIIPFIKNNSEFVIAYEPVNSVGTGSYKDLLYIEEAVKYIKHLLEISKLSNYSVIYGGSVNEDNCYEILNNDIIDGIIVGENSIDINKFINILDKLEVLDEK